MNLITPSHWIITITYIAFFLGCGLGALLMRRENADQVVNPQPSGSWLKAVLKAKHRREIRELRQRQKAEASK